MLDLRIENLSKNFDEFCAVDDVSLKISPGEILVLLGTSGSGKSTLLRMIAGLERPNSGRVLLGDIEITGNEIDKSQVGIILQNDSLQSNLTVTENIISHLPQDKINASEAEEKIKKVLELVKLTGFENRKTSELSLGEKQRLIIAGALVNRPQILLFDEPFANIDAALRNEISLELRKLVKNLDLICVYVTNNQEEAFENADRMAVIENGKIMQVGSPREIYEHPETISVARFIGKNNFIPARLRSSISNSMSEFQTINGEHILIVDNSENYKDEARDQNLTLAIRPENLVLTFGAAFPEDNLLKATIADVFYYGATTRIMLDSSGLILEALVLRLIGLNVGDVCLVGLPPNRITVYTD